MPVINEWRNLAASAGGGRPPFSIIKLAGRPAACEHRNSCTGAHDSPGPLMNGRRASAAIGARFIRKQARAPLLTIPPPLRPRKGVAQAQDFFQPLWGRLARPPALWNGIGLVPLESSRRNVGTAARSTLASVGTCGARHTIQLLELSPPESAAIGQRSFQERTHWRRHDGARKVTRHLIGALNPARRGPAPFFCSWQH